VSIVIEILKETVSTRFNLEMAAAKEIVDIACRIRPDQSTLVPEKSDQITLEAVGQIREMPGL